MIYAHSPSETAVYGDWVGDSFTGIVVGRHPDEPPGKNWYVIKDGKILASIALGVCVTAGTHAFRSRLHLHEEAVDVLKTFPEWMGADRVRNHYWKCPHCGGDNVTPEVSCPRCGGPRADRYGAEFVGLFFGSEVYLV